MEFVIITGLSGAGKSQTMRILEDIGFYGVDNLPPLLLPQFIDLVIQGKETLDKVAFGMDIRGGEFFDSITECLEEIKKKGHTYRIIFLDCSDEILVKRYKEQRRPHPLCPGGRVINGIEKERIKLSNLKNKADHIIDTSNFSSSMLKEVIKDIFVSEKGIRNIMISVLSFGFKYGIPIDADLVFDVRFLPNPFYVENLKKLTGNEQEVREYVMQWEESNTFRQKLIDMVEFLVPLYEKEGKFQLIIAIGCTGGKHRSVTLANELYEYLNTGGYSVFVNHRDCYKE